MRRHHKSTAAVLPLLEHDFENGSPQDVQQDCQSSSDRLGVSDVFEKLFLQQLSGLATVLSNLSYDGTFSHSRSAEDFPKGTVEVAKKILNFNSDGECNDQP